MNSGDLNNSKRVNAANFKVHTLKTVSKLLHLGRDSVLSSAGSLFPQCVPVAREVSVSVQLRLEATVKVHGVRNVTACCLQTDFPLPRATRR